MKPIDMKMKNPTAILCADWHLRDTTPTCRTDDYFMAQCRKVKTIVNLSEKYNIPILHAGDLFDKARSSQYLEQWIIRNLHGPYNIYCNPGNHDLPNHNLKLVNHSSLGVIEASNKIAILTQDIIQRLSCVHNDVVYSVYSLPWGTPLKSIHSTKLGNESGINVLILHHLVSKNEDDLWHGAESEQGNRLLKKLKQFQLILCGHNHQSFIVKNRNQVLVNPGSLMRMNTTQENYKPCVYLWHAKTNEVEPYYLPIEENVIDASHIENKQERDKRMEAFINKLDDDYEIGLSFEHNIEEYFNNNKSKKGTKEIVWEAIG